MVNQKQPTSSDSNPSTTEDWFYWILHYTTKYTHGQRYGGHPSPLWVQYLRLKPQSQMTFQ